MNAPNAYFKASVLMNFKIGTTIYAKWDILCYKPSLSLLTMWVKTFNELPNEKSFKLRSNTST